jgi:hypothetical protein
MDHNLRTLIEKTVREVYEEVKGRKLGGRAAMTAEGAAMDALGRIIQNKVRTGSGLPNDKENKSLNMAEIKDPLQNVAIQYLEILLTDLQTNDPTPTRMWDR